MSLIPIAAPLIRRAVDDDGYALDLHKAVAADGRVLEGLIYSAIRPEDLTWLTPTQWQWFARWRQALGGKLDQVVLFHLAGFATNRFTRFEVRTLVLRDPNTNRLASELSDYPSQLTDVGLAWLTTEAQTTQYPLELMRDSLQCATEASWFALRELTSLGDERGLLVLEQLNNFADVRGISSEVTSRWRYER
ncbi:hypothetical protein [Mycobacterium sp.]|uniref:hypothetical protein n=1 Tax=Mycobacterium sp. TaxID=1785 RepID=UPI003F9BC957